MKSPVLLATWVAIAVGAFANIDGAHAGFCGGICGGDGDCMDTCIDWVTSGASFRGGATSGGGAGGPRLIGRQCSTAVLSCNQMCGKLSKQHKGDCLDACIDACGE
jgi:hypothetical protein